MRKIAFVYVMLLITTTCFSQNDPEIDSLKKLLATPKADTVTAARYIELADFTIFSEDSSLSYLNQAHDLSRKLNWKRGEARSFVHRGVLLGVRGNEVRGLRDLLEAGQISEDLNDSSLLVRCLNGIGLLYLTTEDYQQSLHYLSRAHSVAKTLGDNGWIFATATNMGDLYVRSEKADSALFYFNVCYQIANTSKDDRHGYLAWSFRGLGASHLLLKNYDLALTYLYKGLDHAKASQDQFVVLAFLTNSLAKTYLITGNKDSSIHYSRATIEYGKKSKCSPTILESYKLMATAFKGANADSTSKYLELAYNLKDSVTSATKRNDIASMSYNEERRQKELLARVEREREQRKRNIQFASIDIVMISFIILSLLLSRSIIVKSGIVRFLGVITLLLVFEFINVVIHPFISEITHHSPALMFLIMVIIAALLVPAHHKLEHWITNQLVEKNKRIRLAAAKKTIASLEGQKRSAT
jgi:tetratricopeptide (TPR) repeat protein